jgi:hypothetical protein
MDELVSDGKMQYSVLSQEGIEILLGIVDVIDDLDDDEFFVIRNLVRALPPDSIYDMRWFEDKLAAQRMASGQK